MKFEEFKSTLSGPSPPEEFSAYLKAMWYDAKNNWNQSHNLIQDIDTNMASRIHAYLHRKEGDLGNAGYWYHKAGREIPAYGLEREFVEIVNQLLI